MTSEQLPYPIYAKVVIYITKYHKITTLQNQVQPTCTKLAKLPV